METKGLNIAAIREALTKVLTMPAVFFREMPKTGGFAEPLIFMVVMAAVSGLIRAVLSLFNLHATAGHTMGMESIIVPPFFVAIFGFAGAAILFLIWKLMGSQESYETAYRCAAYISALMPITTPLSLIPYLGPIIIAFFHTYYLVIASSEVHNLPYRKAWLVFGIIGAIAVIISVSA